MVISNLTVASGRTYEIIYNGVQNGALVYIDRTYTYSTIPTSLQGTTYIKTANDDKASSSASFLTFEVNQDVTVYVAHDDRITTKPSWLASFTDTGDNLVTTDTTLSVFASNYLAGTITLGGNEGGYSMYTVVIVGQWDCVLTVSDGIISSHINISVRNLIHYVLPYFYGDMPIKRCQSNWRRQLCKDTFYENGGRLIPPVTIRLDGKEMKTLKVSEEVDGTLKDGWIEVFSTDIIFGGVWTSKE